MCGWWGKKKLSEKSLWGSSRMQQKLFAKEKGEKGDMGRGGGVK